MCRTWKAEAARHSSDRLFHYSARQQSSGCPIPCTHQRPASLTALQQLSEVHLYEISMTCKAGAPGIENEPSWTVTEQRHACD